MGYNMKTQEEILQESKDTFNDFYTPKENGANEHKEFDTLEEFRDKWIAMIREIYAEKHDGENQETY